MTLDQEVDILRRIPLFANIEPAKLKLMAFASERMTYRDGQAVVRQGEQGDSAYVILEGEADVVVDTAGGPLKVANLGRNDIVGDIAILIDVPRTATVTARGELITLKLTKDLFFQLVNDFPEMAVEVMRVLATRLEQTTAALREARAGNGAA
ncbi:MAG: cyclic nucleotide-binding domain-containing protein [Kiloniellales bacterium]|nr:cyclic nucleotide-binding domain-containing protein [Kiloniellales bacterium]